MLDVTIIMTNDNKTSLLLTEKQLNALRKEWAQAWSQGDHGKILTVHDQVRNSLSTTVSEIRAITSSIAAEDMSAVDNGGKMV